MSANGTEARVPRLPTCDVCKYEDGQEGIPARYDGKTVHGPWAFMCQEHFHSHGIGLGTGRGQRLIVTGGVVATNRDDL